jgi:hypothetical protein
MGRNEPCWCNSGEKFKKCHLNREHQPPVNIYELAQKFREQSSVGYCSHALTGPKNCDVKITKAHTIQRRGGLEAIAVDGHVLAVKPTLEGMIEAEGRPSLRRVGVKSASTFPGFCNKHDSELFKPVEGKQANLDLNAAFLLSYRAVAYERFTKFSALSSMKYQQMMDAGKPFCVQVQIQQRLHLLRAGVVRGLSDIDRWKQEYDSRLKQCTFEDFHFCFVPFDRVLPVVACGAYHVEVDFAGRRLQRIARGEGPFEHVAFNLISFGGKSVLLFGWIGAGDGPAASFVESYLNQPTSRQADAAIEMSFELSENVFVGPTWWESLETQKRRRLESRVFSGTGMGGVGRNVDCLVDDGTHLIEADSLSPVQG